MAAADKVWNIKQVNALRLSRNCLMQLVMALRGNRPLLDGLVTGLLVRVLLECGMGTQQYRVARIQGISVGELYAGFSFNDDVTDLYFDLLLPRGLSDVNAQSIQLNSISNSDVSEEEFAAWHAHAVQDHSLPALSEAREKCAALLPVLKEHRIEQSPLLAADVFLPRQATGVAPTVRAEHNRKRRTSPDGSEEDLKRVRSELTEAHRRLNRLHEFPRDFHVLSVDELNDLEDRVVEYLANIRRQKRDLTCCRICMTKEVQIVLLPCKHQVLCTECSTKVKHCPMCRREIEDRIRPHRA